MARSPVAPIVAPFQGDVNQRLSMLADAISKKADVTTEPAYSAVLLRAPNGTTYRLAVSNTGAISTTVVTR
jgi:hypothetical protein